ncbi:cupin domain-containing protein [Mesorhizobium sp. M0016]|uniref:cupin domain-containing protein n=1 Tax=Mesorhizobium sp. M0016 TaxID=2956843 RepID=UPI00333D0B23
MEIQEEAMSGDPFNFISFDEGVQRIRGAWGQSGKAYNPDRVMTSRDEDVLRTIDSLKISGMENGFEKWHLPVYFAKEESQGAQFFITKAEPNAKVREHSHKDGDAMRFIVSGSVIYNGKELVGGDWMFVPKDVPYALDVGPNGAIMCYCYPCCCVPR